MKDTTATAIREWHEKNMSESIMQQRIDYFFEEWCPEDPEEARKFHVEFHMLVRSIYAEAGEPAHRQLTKLIQTMPIQITGGKL